MDYLEQNVTAETRQQEIDGAKHDTAELPYFSKEVPASSSKKQNGELIVITYNWKNLYESSLKVKEIVYEKDNDLEDLYKLAVKDGIEKAAFNHKGKTYIIRKVLRSIADLAYGNAKKVAGLVEKLIGHLKTVLDNWYVIIRLEKEAWVFDSALQAEGIKHLDCELLKEEQKKKLFDEVSEKLSDIHSKNFILGEFSLNNLMLYNDSVIFSDLRMLKETRKKSFLVNEFERVLATLLGCGLGSREDLAYSVRYYICENNSACREWFKETIKRDAINESEIAELLESRIHA